MSSMDENAPEYTELIDCYALHISENTGTTYTAARIQGMAGVAKIRAEAKADAWDEGEKAGHWNTTERMGGPMNNPYRKE